MFLELRDVSFCYPKQKRPVLTGINLTFTKQGITAIVGPNGCGKTTLTKLMMGILTATSGEIRLEDRILAEYSLAAIGQRIGYVFQNPEQQLFCPTVSEEIGFGLINRGYASETVRKRVNYYLDYFELATYRNIFPLHLSRGEKQRLAIAAVLANEPEFLIMDEPTVGLDAYRKKLLSANLQKIAGQGRGLIVVSHDYSFVQRIAQRVVALENGQIKSDSVSKGNDGNEA